uniref:DUF659 domain-containing protein n=1 Tax=Aegilops tauschii subsp. strangulata TaxID=200361 RepID=A0A452XPM9_AEGTS
MTPREWIKTKEYIFEKLKEVIEEVGVECVVQVVTDNAANRKAAGLMIEAKYKNIFWTPCIEHTLNLALKNICDPNNNEGDNFHLWFIEEVTEEASFIKNFVMTHIMRWSMFHEFNKLKFLQIADTRFASVVIMLKRLLLIKVALVQMVVHPNWAAYREDDTAKAQRVKEHVLNDIWWDIIEYVVSFTEPIYAMIRLADTDKPCLHLIYEMWDSMIEKVKMPIYRFEGKEEGEECILYDIIKEILVSRWTKSNTPLHCLAHSLNPRYYSPAWINEVPGRISPNADHEVTEMRNKCFQKFYPDQEDFKTIKKEFADFALFMNAFENPDSIEDRADFEPQQWWGTHGVSTRLLIFLH